MHNKISMKIIIENTRAFSNHLNKIHILSYGNNHLIWGIKHDLYSRYILQQTDLP